MPRFDRLRVVLGLVSLLGGACDPSAPEPLKTPRKPLMAGAGEALIDLPVGHSTAGYAQSKVLSFKFPKDEPGSPFADLFPASRGMMAPPRTKALLLDTGETRVALVKIDAIATSDVLVARTLELVRKHLGLKLENHLIVSATHTHAAGARFATSMRIKPLEKQPGWHQDAIGHGLDSFNPESVDRVARSIMAALAQAKANLRPAMLGYARGERVDANHDRRCQDRDLYPEGSIDRAVRVIRVDEVDATGRPVVPIAVLVNFAMHGTIYDALNHWLSGDGPGLVEDKLAERFDKPVVTMFMQGAAGDVSPGGVGEGSQRMQDLGYRIAEEAYRLYHAVTTPASPQPPGYMPLSRDLEIRMLTRRIPLSHKLLGYKENEFFTDGGILCMYASNQDCPAAPEPVRPIRPEAVNCLGEALPGKGKYHTDIAVLEIGALTILTLPGEPVSEVARQAVARAQAEGAGETWVYGYAQDHNGYILMPDDWLRGGYEPTISYWGWRFAPYLLDQVADLVHELRTGKAQRKRPAPRVSFPPIEYEPVPATAHQRPPALLVAPTPKYTRFQTVTITWTGGDPALGLPTVRVVNRDGVPLRVQGWRDVSNRTYEIATAYQAEPNYAAVPDAKARDHKWTAIWDVPAWVLADAYRLVITGQTLEQPGAPPVSYEIQTPPFEILPNRALSLTAACDGNGDGTLDASGDYFAVTASTEALYVRLAAFYPQPRPEWDNINNKGDHQTANFRLFTERGHVYYPFSAPLKGRVQVYKDAVWLAALEMAWQDDGSTDKMVAICPLHPTLPRLEGSLPLQGPGVYRVQFSTGDVTDIFGNAVAGATREITL